MQMALDATSAHDPESQAWHYAQLGDLQYQLGHFADAEREYRHALFTFADHPLAVAGLARLDAPRGTSRWQSRGGAATCPSRPTWRDCWRAIADAPPKR